MVMLNFWSTFGNKLDRGSWLSPNAMKPQFLSSLMLLWLLPTAAVGVPVTAPSAECTDNNSACQERTQYQI